MRPALVLLGLSTLLTIALPAQAPAGPGLTIGELQAATRRDEAGRLNPHDAWVRYRQGVSAPSRFAAQIDEVRQRRAAP